MQALAGGPCSGLKQDKNCIGTLSCGYDVRACGDGVKDARDNQVGERVLVVGGLDADANSHSYRCGDRKEFCHQRKCPRAELSLKINKEMVSTTNDLAISAPANEQCPPA